MATGTWGRSGGSFSSFLMGGRGFALLLSAAALFALFAGDLAAAEIEWVPGEVLVQMTEDAPMRVHGRHDVELPPHVLAKARAHGLKRTEALFPEHARAHGRGAAAKPDGPGRSEEAKLGRWMRLELDASTSIPELAKDLAALEDVEVAEPNYIYRAIGVPAEEKIAASSASAPSPVSPHAFIPNDPEFSTQWGLDWIDAPEAWDLTMGSSSQVIAIIDTGVDLDHEDLASKIWANPYEAIGDKNGDGCPGVCGVDDDGDGLIDEGSIADDDENGYVDDLRGWDWVNADADPNDDNGHGTHCAGIAAAATNNGIGIAGVCPSCRIMPLKVMSSNGTGSVSDQAKAVEYAWRNGATVISMSFGSSADSSILRNALAAAYPHATLVAAAGNERKSKVEPLCMATGLDLAVEPFYPAAYGFVISVEAIRNDGSLADFSNCGYKVRDPGVLIKSAWGNGGYHTLSGTSMAAPMIAGIAGLLRSLKSGDPTWDAGLIHTQLVSAGGNAYQALTAGPQPKLVLSAFHVQEDSTCVVCDGDSSADAGETLAMFVTIRNDWANATGVTGTISTTDPRVTILSASSTWGSVGSNAEDANLDNPFRLSIDSGTPDDHVVELTLQVDPGNGGMGFTTIIPIVVRSAVEKRGILSSDETWTSDKLYVIPGNFKVPFGVTLTIAPGTTIRLLQNASFYVEGTVLAEGIGGEPITFEVADDPALPPAMEQAFIVTGASNTTVDAAGNYVSGTRFEYVRFERALDLNFGTGVLLEKVLIRDPYRLSGGRYKYSLLNNVNSFSPLWPFQHNSIIGGVEDGVSVSADTWASGLMYPNNVFSHEGFEVRASGPQSFNLSNWYWGTKVLSEINSEIFDFTYFASAGEIDPEPFLGAPDPLAPAVVSSIEVQPGSVVGAERVTFHVTFSKEMRCMEPQLFFGTTPPYIQKRATLNPRWLNFPCTEWAVDANITKFTGDGNYRIVVMGAVDPDNFPLPTGDYRFGFEVITSGTSSAALSAVGGAGRVDLTWNPSSSETLAGYNVYRASTSGGPYTKLNGPLIADTFYSDITADPGITYYYLYREINTSLEEGPNSDEAAAAALDDVPPVVTHTPTGSAPAGIPITISATITDNAGIPTGAIFYRTLGSADPYIRVDMINASGPSYTANIPASAAVAPGVEYYIEGFDGVTQVYHGSEASPHPVNIVDRPVISSVSPVSGASTGGTSVTITGGNFQSGATVSFGGTAATDVIIVDSTTITCTTPAHYPMVADLSVTNPNNETGTLTRAFTFEGSQTTVRLPSAATGDRQTTTQIDLSTPGVTDAISATLEFIYDPTILSFQSAALGTLTGGWSLSTNGTSAGSVRISLAGSTPVTGLGSFVTVTFNVIGDPAAVSSLTWVETTLNAGAIPTTPENGQFTVNNAFDVSGTVTYYSGGLAVPGATVTLSGPSSYSQTTASDGTYTIGNAPSANYSLAATKSDGVTSGSISALDASQVLQADAGLITLTANQVRAADTDGSGIVSAFDATQILQYAASLTGLPFQGSGKVWTFTPSSYNFSPLNLDQTNQNFSGILIGDVTGNWTSASTMSAARLLASTGSATISVGSSTICGSTTVPVQVSSISGAALYGIELDLSYDPNAVSIDTVAAGAQASGWAIVANDQPGLLRVAMASATPIQTTGTLLNLGVSVSGSVDQPILVSRVVLNEGTISGYTDNGTLDPCVAGDVNGDGVISVLDLFHLINHVHGGGPSPVGDGDINDDTKVDAADVIYLETYLFAGGAAPQ